MPVPSQADRLEYLRTLLVSVIDDYRLGRSNLSDLSSGIEALLWELEGVAPRALTDPLREEWVGIETVHALSLDEDRRVTEEEQRAVTQSIDNVERLLDTCNRSGDR